MNANTPEAPAAAPPGVAAIYVRISLDRAGAGLGVERQEEDCRPLCLSRGYPADRIRLYADNDISAYSGKLRPQYRQLLKDIESGEVTFLAAWHTDRLHRRTSELEEFIEVIDSHRVDVATVQAGQLDLSTPSGRMVARIVGATAAYESEHKAERISRQKRQSREKGLPSGGPRPFGWKRRPDGGWDPMVHDSVEAAHILKAAEDVFAGASLADVARDWRTACVGQPQTGKPSWTVDAVRQVLSNPRNAGLIGHRVEMPGRKSRGYVRYARPVILGPATWPAIIEPERWESLMSLLDQRGADKRVPRRRSLLTGLLACSLCGGPMVRANTGTRPVYRCPSSGSGVYPNSCGRVSIDANGLEELLVEAVMQALDTAQLARVAAAESNRLKDARGAMVQIRELEVRMDQAAESFAAGRLSVEAYERLTAAHEQQRAVLRAKIATSDETLGLEPLLEPGVLRRQWPTLGLDQRRTILAVAIEKVTISPAVKRSPRFDDTRVDLTWRA